MQVLPEDRQLRMKTAQLLRSHQFGIDRGFAAQEANMNTAAQRAARALAAELPAPASTEAAPAFTAQPALAAQPLTIALAHVLMQASQSLLVGPLTQAHPSHATHPPALAAEIAPLAALPATTTAAQPSAIQLTAVQPHEPSGLTALMAAAENAAPTVAVSPVAYARLQPQAKQRVIQKWQEKRQQLRQSKRRPIELGAGAEPIMYGPNGRGPGKGRKAGKKTKPARGPKAKKAAVKKASEKGQ